jgi:hypothetical protein
MNPEVAEYELIEQTSDFLNEALIEEWRRQGHSLTGAWERSLQYTIINTGDGISSSAQMNGYGVFINTGVGPGSIPYGGPSTGAKQSRYINGLIAFWKLRGLSDAEAKRAAFATANKQKSEGMPTGDSYRFSETGQRTQFIEIVNNGPGEKVDEMMSDGIDNIIDELFHETKPETI